MSAVLATVLADLRAEGAGLATQVAHLAWTDEVPVLAAGARTDRGRSAWDAADRWLDIAQCFAGPPGVGRGRG